MAKKDGLDGYCNISEKYINLYSQAVDYFQKNNLAKIARQKGWSNGEMFEALISPLKGLKGDFQRCFSFSIPTQKAKTRNGNCASPAAFTYVVTMGLKTRDDNTCELTPIGKYLIDKRLSVQSYSLMILSKVGVYDRQNQDYRISNLLTVFCKYAINHPNDIYTPEKLEKVINPIGIMDARFDISFNALAISGLLSITNSGEYQVTNQDLTIVKEIAEHGDQISGPNNDTSSFMGSYDKSILEIINKNNFGIFNTKYADLVKIKGLKTVIPQLQATSVLFDSLYRQYITAIKSKPFLLLAGISGTGKSRIVREFAFKSCPEYLQDKSGTTPGNYCMIEVKPNWHDSTELLGYYSRLGKAGYQFTKFVKFLVKAKMFPTVPFFVCLDEMNLAPVEQYFAEILSILETRKHPKNEETGEVDMNMVKTEPIIDAQYFRELSEMSHTKNAQTGEPFSSNLTDRDIYLKLFEINTKEAIEKEQIAEEVGNRYELTTEGLTLPDNVVIIGTVNMDDTTHQFSRKVIDRAMTIEMNGGNLRNMFGGSKNLEYLPEEEQKKWQNAFSRQYVTADEVLEAHSDEAEELMNKLPSRLEEINKALKGTPFEVSYRVLNELTIMVGVMLDEGMDLDDAIAQSVNNILLMKILPRIEGDAEMFALSKEYKTKVVVTYDNRLEWLKNIAPDIKEPLTDAESDNNDTEEKAEAVKEHQSTAKDKIQEMIDRLNNQEFTRFWP